MKFKTFLSGALCIAALECGGAFAGDFSVNPVRIDLGASVRSGAIGVRNEGKDKLSFQLQAMAWTQDEAGKDQYAETQDLIFFPKILSVEPGTEGVVRVGARNTVIQSEKTYRLFIEEMPGLVKAPEGGGAQINILMRFGAPIFVAAVKPQDGLVIEAIALSKGVLTFSARNTGNRHQVVQAVDLKGFDPKGGLVYSLTLADRYLLAGTRKSFSTVIAPDQCAKIAVLAIDMKTDKAAVSAQKPDVVPAMCP